MRIIIAGPTASGKSSLAMRIARLLDGEIVSVDSRQCYRMLDIGTAKPPEEDLSEVPHHNISILDLTENDTAASFRIRALKAAEEIERRNHTVIFCGGSTLHLQSLIQPLDDLPGANEQNLSTLKEWEQKKGIEYLYGMLQEHDPDYAASMDGMNRQRIYRALDVWMQTGKPFSSFHTHEKPTLPENYILFALHHPRKVLHDRISMRTDRMLEEGLVEETEAILSQGYSPELQSLQTVGYRQVIDYLNGSIGYDKMAEDIKTATRRYAKRQITWLRRWDFVNWLDMSRLSKQEAADYICAQVAADTNKG
ncbi:tRNA (adenosine(37)-N6)-dimethylallyltransferase MiaA [Rhodohalobacter mucosus]|uniref:tRNA dimethylallyltransferase n=2 Tax=Rhodohalobacter mucosus TaxID=2079485 RepID=A0A316TP47_9BACT|nr:tRNA (adenosine(37)-N6)-dimethylallyltransferase MiaA [Rhodohalobacter mucosus]